MEVIVHIIKIKLNNGLWKITLQASFYSFTMKHFYFSFINYILLQIHLRWQGGRTCKSLVVEKPGGELRMLTILTPKVTPISAYFFTLYSKHLSSHTLKISIKWTNSRNDFSQISSISSYPTDFKIMKHTMPPIVL